MKRTRLSPTHLVLIAALLLAGCNLPGPAPAALPTQAGDLPAPVVTPAPPPAMLAAGAGHTCLLAAGQVTCWGANQFGQLGGENDITAQVSGTPLAVRGLPPGVTAIAAGVYHTCAQAAGEVWCWGRNNAAQLGSPDVPEFTALPAPVPGLEGALSGAVEAGGGQGSAGDVGGGSPETGGGMDESAAVPAAPGGILAAGGDHTCAVTRAAPGGGEAVTCWGSYITGAPEGSQPADPTPYSLGGFPARVTALAAGYSFTCALLEGGAVTCWGAGESAEIHLAAGAAPQAVTLPAPAVQIAAGGYRACAVLEGGALWCWERGQAPTPAQPAQIVGLAGPARAVTAGEGHLCVLIEGGTVQCLGDNYFGQVRAEDQPGSDAPITQNLQGVNALQAGTNHTCALLESGVLTCWGDRSSGQLGDGSLRWK